MTNQNITDIFKELMDLTIAYELNGHQLPEKQMGRMNELLKEMEDLEIKESIDTYRIQTKDDIVGDISMVDKRADE